MKYFQRYRCYRVAVFVPEQGACSSQKVYISATVCIWQLIPHLLRAVADVNLIRNENDAITQAIAFNQEVENVELTIWKAAGEQFELLYCSVAM